jgi:hypothetical protein
MKQEFKIFKNNRDFTHFETESIYKLIFFSKGKNLEGQRLLIKYPDNPNTALLSSIVLKNQNKR